MRIAQVSPLYESVPPKLYGGTERIVFQLTEELVKLGHEVTLFASSDSRVSARLVSCGSQAMRLAKAEEVLVNASYVRMFEQLRKEASFFDLIHFHTEVMHFNLVRSLNVPALTTLHGRLDFPIYESLFREFSDLPVVSISQSQRAPLPFLNWQGTVYHGLDPETFPFSAGGGPDLVFLGRISAEKGLAEAVEIARRSGRRLRVAAKIVSEDDEYYQRCRPLLEESFVEYVGEISDREKKSFLGEAAALLFPIRWPEPFGLVMIEALAMGTPVIAYRHGSVPEVIRHQETGFIVEDMDGAVEAVGQIERIQRRSCRSDFEARFSRARMVRDYVDIYRRLIAGTQAAYVPNQDQAFPVSCDLAGI